MRQRRLLLVVPALILSLLLCGSLAGVAHAQSFVIGSDPVDGTTIASVPTKIRIFFNAPISSLSSAHVYSVQNGKLVDVTAAPSQIAAGNSRELDTPLKNPASLPSGSYQVNWTALSNDDGRTTYGIIGFNVGFSSTGLSGVAKLGPSTSNALDGPNGIRTLTPLRGLLIFWDWLARLALVLWIGILALELLLAHSSGRIGQAVHTATLLERAHKQTRNLQWLCLLGLFFSEIVALSLRVIQLTEQLQRDTFSPEVLLGVLSSSRYGILWIACLLIIAIIMLLLYRKSRAQNKPTEPEPAQLLVTESGPLRQFVTGEIGAVTTANLTRDRVKHEEKAPRVVAPHYNWFWLLLTGLLVFTYAFTGGITNAMEPHASAIVFAWIQLVAQGLWFGGLAYFGFVLLPLLRASERDQHAEALALLLRRVAPLLLCAMGMLIVSNLFLSEAGIYDIQQLVNDAYGRTLLVQLLITILLLLVNSYVLFILRPRLTRQALLLPVVGSEMPARRARQSALEHSERRLRQSTTMQAWLGAGVLLCASLMIFFAPPIAFPDVTYSNPPATGGTSIRMQTKQVGDLSVTLMVLPGKVNPTNTIILTIVDQSGQPVTDADVKLTVNMAVMDMGTRSTSIKGGNAVYTAVLDRGFDMQGLWTIDASIERPGKPSLQETFQVQIEAK
ncbi:MAG: copper resistance protein CopC [Ktedonobacteraceae bacterium]|nr:copper resistance protein CopC [Ktedonobacteraceae bacterium]